MRKFFSLLAGVVPAGLSLLAPALLSSCASMGLTGSRDYQYYGGWGNAHHRHYVPVEVRRVEPWLKSSPESSRTRRAGKPGT